MASSKLYVPQLVILPTVFSSPWKRDAHILTTSFSMTLNELKMTGFNALEWIYFTKQASVSSLCFLEC